MINGQTSLWISELDERPDFPSVTEEITTEFAIIGGGLSGLWTAYFLKQLHPQAQVSLFEAQRIAHGASGRACGWLSGKPVGIREELAKVGGRDGVIQTENFLRAALDEISEIFVSNNKDIGAHRGGTLQIARSNSEARRLTSYVNSSREWGVSEENLRLLDAAETSERVQASETTLSAFSPDMIRVDPAQMTIALAEIVRDLGVQIFENSPVSLQPDQAPTVNGYSLKARRFTIATEAYTAKFPGKKRLMLPMNSSLISTKPLSRQQWDKIGWENAEGLSGSAHTYFYSARTPDGRIALGGRGKPYRFASGFDRNGEVDNDTVSSLEKLLAEIFPQVSLEVDHAWCGVIGVTRDWSPFVYQDPINKSVMMGGYAGQGLTAAYLAGRIASSLLMDTTDQYTSLPWVRNFPRRWEPEPLRWIGANGLYRVYSFADWREQRRSSDATAFEAKVADRVSGRSTKLFN